MKKLTTSVFLILFACLTYAQSNYFTPTTYKGAIDPDSTKDWTKGWTNWDPTATVYPATTVTVAPGDITTNTTWTKNNVYLLGDGYIYVTGGATLTIEAGTTIRGTGKATIIICRGSKIYAKGTLAEPIIFTSSKGASLRAPGDWGGIVLTGRGIHNLPQGDTAAAEGGIAKPVTGPGEIDGRHGGTNDNDSSGVMSYCRVEFAGIPLTTAANSEINGITFYSVGRKTQIDHIMVSYSGDDSYEWFGGAVNCRYLIAYAGIDDDFDTDNGYKGSVQFGIGARIPSNADQSGSNGFESDNDANGSNNLPRTSAVFSNMTIIGPLYNGQTASVNANFKRAAHIRRNSALTVVNSILGGYPDAGLLIDSRLTNSHFQNGTAVFKANVIGGIPNVWAGKLAAGSDTLAITTSAAVAAWVVSNQTDTLNQTNQINLVRPFDYTNPSYVPASNSLAVSGTNFLTGKTPVDAKPVANFAFAQTSPSSRSFIFNNLSNTRGFASSYAWDFGVSSSTADTSSAASPSFTFPANGFYNVSLKVKNAYDSSSVTLNVGVTVTVAQNNFFDFTTYRGALSPDSTKDWTKGWSNFDPTNTVYPATTVNVAPGDITTNTTWTKNNVYLLGDGYIYVTGGATLTIEAGTIIRGTGKGTIIICRGSKINAQGTLAEPIIFTSSKGAGLRAPGDWGGIVFTGRAVHNLPQGDTAAAEGGIAKPVTGPGEIDGRHGGTNDDDSSGIMTYCRVEFAGIPLTTAANSEINGITFYSVGRKTILNHLQVSYSGDDSYEWFGGTVNAKYLIAYAGIDDDFDTDNGFRGNVQYGIGARIPSNADQSGSNGFESDNDANGSTNTPRTAAVFSNMTIVGPLYNGQTATVNSNFKRAAHIRRNSALNVVNSILTGYPDAGLLIDSRLTSSHLQTGTSFFKANVIGGIPSGWAGKMAAGSDTIAIANSTAAAAWVVANQTDTFRTSNEVNLTRPNAYTNPSYVPASISIANSGSNFTTGKTPFNSKPIVDFTFSQSVPNSKTYNFSNATDTRGITTRYSWNFGVTTSTADTSSLENPSFTFPANGTYIVTLTAVNTFDSSFMSKNVVVYVTDKPAANFTFAQSTTVGSRLFNFTNTTDTKGYATTYAWDFGVVTASDDTSSAENPSYTYAANGTYNVRLIASNAFLSDTVIKVVSVIATDVKEANAAFSQIAVYPNPASDKFMVSLDLLKSNNVSLEVIDITGKQILSSMNHSLSSGLNQFEINTSEMKAGIYFLQISTPETSTSVRLVVIK